MVRLNLSLDDMKNCKETTTFVKECKKIIEYKKKEILNWAYKQGLSFENWKIKKPDKFSACKTRKSARKLEVIINFK